MISGKDYDCVNRHSSCTENIFPIIFLLIKERIFQINVAGRVGNLCHPVGPFLRLLLMSLSLRGNGELLCRYRSRASSGELETFPNRIHNKVRGHVMDC